MQSHVILFSSWHCEAAKLINQIRRRASDFVNIWSHSSKPYKPIHSTRFLCVISRQRLNTEVTAMQTIARRPWNGLQISRWLIFVSERYVSSDTTGKNECGGSHVEIGGHSSLIRLLCRGPSSWKWSNSAKHFRAVDSTKVWTGLPREWELEVMQKRNSSGRK